MSLFSCKRQINLDLTRNISKRVYRVYPFEIIFIGHFVFCFVFLVRGKGGVGGVVD